METSCGHGGCSTAVLLPAEKPPAVERAAFFHLNKTSPIVFESCYNEGGTRLVALALASSLQALIHKLSQPGCSSGCKIEQLCSVFPQGRVSGNGVRKSEKEENSLGNECIIVFQLLLWGGQGWALGGEATCKTSRRLKIHSFVCRM